MLHPVASAPRCLQNSECSNQQQAHRDVYKTLNAPTSSKRTTMSTKLRMLHPVVSAEHRLSGKVERSYLSSKLQVYHVTNILKHSIVFYFNLIFMLHAYQAIMFHIKLKVPFQLLVFMFTQLLRKNSLLCQFSVHNTISLHVINKHV